MRNSRKINGIVNKHGFPIKSQVVDHAAELWGESEAIALRCTGKCAEQLTSAERFALCVITGASLRYERSGDAPGTMQTVYPCKVVDKEGGGLSVVQLTPPPVPETKGGGGDAPPNIPTTILNRPHVAHHPFNPSLGGGGGCSEPSSGAVCDLCGDRLRFNVPRMGFCGGFVHADTGSFHCHRQKCSKCNGSGKVLQETGQDVDLSCQLKEAMCEGCNGSGETGKPLQS